MADVKKELPKAEYLKNAPFYTFIKGFFVVCNHVFYNTIRIVTPENIGKHGEATILAFNHGNGLVDSTLLIESARRQVRFCAKDTIWAIPVFGQLVKYSGAIPVYRPKEHGEKAQEYNEYMFSNAYEALLNGECLGIAPEGVSRFASNLAQPLKTGPARIALKCLSIALNERNRPEFKIKIVPAGLVYTHREKFRSSVSVEFCKPIVVDKNYLDGFALSKDASVEDKETWNKKIAYDITEKINEALKNSTLHSPDFHTTKLSLTATRIAIPVGTSIELNEYFNMIREWINVFTNGGEDADVKDLKVKLETYQSLLDEKRVKDERVSRRMRRGRPAHVVPTFFLILFRFLIFVGLFVLILPGMLVWSPFILIIYRQEKKLLQKGVNWNDSVSEMKYFWGFVFCVCVVLISPMVYSPLILMAMFLTMRLYEEAVANARALYSHFKFAFITTETMKKLLSARRDCMDALRKVIESDKFNSVAALSTTGIKRSELCTLEATLRVYPWQNFHLFRRRKKDWNEILRMHDYNTMDYF